MEMKCALNDVDGDVNNLLYSMSIGLPQLLAYISGEQSRIMTAVRAKRLEVRQ